MFLYPIRERAKQARVERVSSGWRCFFLVFLAFSQPLRVSLGYLKFSRLLVLLAAVIHSLGAEFKPLRLSLPQFAL